MKDDTTCPICGTEIRHDTCSGCGAKLHTSDDTRQNNDTLDGIED